MMSQEPLIKITDFWWKYEGRKEWALKGVNLEIYSGEFVTIIGPNEAGKTTLVMSMNGLIPNNYRGVMRGNVVVAGMDTRRYSTSDISRYVGFVFSDPESQFLTMTVEEEIAFGLENMGLPIHEIESRIKWAMNIVGLDEELLEKPPYELSGGQKQRVALASVLAMKPKIIILDEPTSMLDPVGRSEIINALRELKKSYDVTIILVEHRLEDVIPLSNRVILLYNGEVILDSSPVEAFNNIDFLLEHDVFPPEAMIYIDRLRKMGVYNGEIPLTFDESVEVVRKTLRRR